MASVTEQLAARKTNGGGRMRKMVERMSLKQLERRTAKIALHTQREGTITRGMLMGVLQLLNRGFFGRMKYIFLGR
jgi:hypothetical protein